MTDRTIKYIVTDLYVYEGDWEREADEFLFECLSRIGGVYVRLRNNDGLISQQMGFCDDYSFIQFKLMIADRIIVVDKDVHTISDTRLLDWYGMIDAFDFYLIR